MTGFECVVPNSMSKSSRRFSRMNADQSAFIREICGLEVNNTGQVRNTGVALTRRWFHAQHAHVRDDVAVVQIGMLDVAEQWSKLCAGGVRRVAASNCFFQFRKQRLFIGPTLLDRVGVFHLVATASRAEKVVRVGDVSNYLPESAD